LESGSAPRPQASASLVGAMSGSWLRQFAVSGLLLVVVAGCSTQSVQNKGALGEGRVASGTSTSTSTEPVVSPPSTGETLVQDCNVGKPEFEPTSLQLDCSGGEKVNGIIWTGWDITPLGAQLQPTETGLSPGILVIPTVQRARRMLSKCRSRCRIQCGTAGHSSMAHCRWLGTHSGDTPPTQQR